MTNQIQKATEEVTYELQLAISSWASKVASTNTIADQDRAKTRKETREIFEKEYERAKKQITENLLPTLRTQKII